MSVAGEYTNRRLMVANRQRVLNSEILKVKCFRISIGWDGKENGRPKVTIEEGRGSTAIPIPRFGSCFHHGDETCKNKYWMNYKGMIWVWGNVRSMVGAVGWESFPHLCSKLSEAEDLVSDMYFCPYSYSDVWISWLTVIMPMPENERIALLFSMSLGWYLTSSHLKSE